MKREIRADYDTQYLFPPCVEDWVPSDHPARFIREFVEILDLRELGFKHPDSAEGGKVYAPDILLKAWLYGYIKKIRSTRGLEEACREHMSLVWLTGNHAPDHNTLWRFLDENSVAMKLVFKKAVRVALDAGLMGMVVHAVDGTKIKSKGAKSGALRRRDVERLLKELDGSIDEMIREAKESEEAGYGEYRLPSELLEREALRARLGEVLEQMDEIERDHLNPCEPDARMMKCKGTIELAFNGQVVVDEQSEMIVAQEVVNEENDVHQLTPMLDKVEENAGCVADETLADAGYCSSEELSKAEEKKYSVLVNVNSESDGEFHWTKFNYDEAADCVICPLGHRLEFSHIDNSEKRARRVYICKAYKECPKRWECSRAKRVGRRIRLLPNQAALSRNHRRLMEPSNAELMRKRKVIVEKTFGIIKECTGFRRWTFRGLNGARTQWAIICTAFNLKKMYAHWVTGKLILKHQ